MAHGWKCSWFLRQETLSMMRRDLCCHHTKNQGRRLHQVLGQVQNSTQFSLSSVATCNYRSIPNGCYDLGKSHTVLNTNNTLFVKFCTSDAVIRRRRPVVPNAKSTEYLASIGLDCDRLKKSRPTVLKQDVNSLQEHVNLLQSLGLDNSQIVNIIYKEASFLRKDVKRVHELIQYLRHTGCKNEQIANIFQRAPRFFTTPETVIGNIEYMKFLDVSDKNICYMLVYCPSLFYRVQGGVERVASYLKRIMTEEQFAGDQNNVIRYIMRNDPILFVRQASELENNITFLKSIGFHGEDLVSVFRYCPSSIRIGTEFLKARLDYLQKRLELSNEKLKDLIRRHPALLHASVETIQTHIDLVLELGFTIDDIVKTPRIFARSTTNIRKRYEELTAVGFKPNLGSFIYSKERHDSTVLKFKMRKLRLDKEKEENEGHIENNGTV